MVATNALITDSFVKIKILNLDKRPKAESRVYSRFWLPNRIPWAESRDATLETTHRLLAFTGAACPHNVRQRSYTIWCELAVSSSALFP